MFDPGWQRGLGIDFGDLQWTDTGERLPRASFDRYRRQGGSVIAHMIPEPVVQAAVTSPLTIIASDGRLKQGKGHPRSAGTYARVLGRFVREARLLSWTDAVRKMSLMPAQRLERRAPLMKNKGRIRAGADADVVVFDPVRVIDHATYEAPARPSEGIVHVLVNGVPLVRDGALVEGVTPGRPIRAPF
jgi:dihydroorotase